MREVASGDVAGRTPLMLAAFRGDLAAVRRLLASGVDVDARDKDGVTALMFASHKGHLAIVRELLLRGANVYARAKNGWTPKRAARAGHHHAVVEMLKSADVGRAACTRWCGSVGGDRRTTRLRSRSPQQLLSRSKKIL